MLSVYLGHYFHALSSPEMADNKNNNNDIGKYNNKKLTAIVTVIIAAIITITASLFGLFHFRAKAEEDYSKSLQKACKTVPETQESG